MNDHQFEMLLSMVQQAGEGGFILAILYMTLPVLSSVIAGSLFAFCAYKIVQTVAGTIRSVGLGKDIGTLVGVSWTGDIRANHADQIRRAVAFMKDRHLDGNR